ncbi:MAG: RimK family alpha-L-glutamate ligase, partial [Thauera sp.]|nr:RimK family alpha-L-glutamate ligase [Thauera sp.]
MAGGGPSAARVAIFTDETGWHTRRLRQALARRGFEGRCVDLADCRFDTTATPHGLVIPGFGRSLPRAALVRGIAGGSLEQITKRLGILHALRELGVPVYNDARAIERSVDKAMTSF